MNNTNIKSNWKALGQHSIDSSLDIKVELQELHSNSGGLTTFKGTCTLPVSLSRIAFCLEDVETRKKWVARIGEHFLIHKSDDGLEYDTYEHYDMVWPVSDRDYIVRHKWLILNDTPSPTVELHCHSIQNEEFPIKNGIVRGDLQRLVISLQYMGQNESKISVEIQVDPKGSLPSFFANIIQKNWPVNTLKAIYNEAKKEGKEHSIINEILKS